jgi:hypothetical protein
MMVEELKLMYEWNGGLDDVVAALRKKATGEGELFPDMDKVRTLLATDEQATKVHPQLKAALRENMLQCAQESTSGTNRSTKENQRTSRSREYVK